MTKKNKKKLSRAKRKEARISGKNKSKTKSKSVKKAKSGTLKFTQQQGLFPELSLKDRIKIMKEIGKNAEGSVDDLLQEIKDLFLKIDPIHLLSEFSYKYLVEMNKSKMNDFNQTNPLLPHHIEFMQAMLLKNDISDYKPVSGYINYFPEIEDKLKELFFNFSLERFKTVEDDEDKLQEFFILESLRIHTLSVRGWAYEVHLIEILKGIFHKIDPEFESKTGLSASEIIDMLLGLDDKISINLAEYSEIVGRIMKNRTIKTILKAFKKQLPDVKWELSEINSTLSEFSKEARVEMFKSMVFTFLGTFFLQYYFMISIEDYAKKIGKTVKELKQIFKSVSMGFGDLKSSYEGHFFLKNPVWQKPFVLYNDNVLLIPLIFDIAPFIVNLLEKIINENNILSNENKKYHDSRSDYLEEKTYEIFSRKFGSENVFWGVKWQKEEDGELTEYENDVIIKYYNILIIAEAKSNRISGSITRGSLDGLKSTLDDTIIYGTNQSLRLLDHLNEVINFEKVDKYGKRLLIDITEIEQVIRVNITLDRIGDLSANLKDLKEIGLFPSDLEIVPSLSLADLMIIDDILEIPSEFIHYFIRRGGFEKNANFSAEEIDLLSFYIQNSFNIGDTEYDDNVKLGLYGASYFFNNYYLKLNSKKPKKPKRHFTSFWSDLISKIEERKMEYWIQATNILYNCTFDDQLLFEAQFNKTIIKIRNERFRGDPEQECFTYMEYGPTNLKEAIIGFAYNGISRDKRNQILSDFAAKMTEDNNLLYSLAIGIDTDLELSDLPYHILLVYRPKAK